VRLPGEQSDPAAGGGEAGDPEAVRVAQNDVDGLGADGTGRPEDDDVARPFRHALRAGRTQMRISEGFGHAPILTALR
jgi:hypothetical protein